MRMGIKMGKTERDRKKREMWEKGMRMGIKMGKMERDRKERERCERNE